MRDNTKAREDKNVYFWVAEESEQVLVKDGVSSSSWIKKSGI